MRAIPVLLAISIGPWGTLSARTQQPTVTAEELITAFRSPELSVRRSAVERTERSLDRRGVQDLFRNPQVESALFDLVRREHAALRSPNPADRGIVNSNNDGEGYAEYHAQVLSLAMATVPFLASDSKRDWLNILARDAYNPESDFAIWLAGFGDLVVDALLDHAVTGPTRSDRANAHAVLACLVAFTAYAPAGRSSIIPPALSFANRQRALKAINAGLQSEDDIVSHEVVRALRRAPSVETLTLLQEFARQSRVEPRFTRRGELRMSLQEEVDRVIAEMQAALSQKR